MEDISYRGKILRTLIVIILITISLFPPIIRMINSGERIGTIILGILLLFGGLLLRWFFLFIFIFVLHAISNGLFKVFIHGIGRSAETSKDETEKWAGAALVASFIIVIILQFFGSWGLGIPLIPNLVTFYFPQYNM